MLAPPRKGSLKMATGRRKTSELSPGAWFVDEPSKFHSLSSDTDLGACSSVMVLHRRPPSPSIQDVCGGESASVAEMSHWLALLAR